MPYWNEPGLTWDHPLAKYDDPRTFAEILNPSKPMLDVVLDARNLSVPELITRIRAISVAARGKTDFASMVAWLTALEAKLDLLAAEEGNLRDAENAVKAQTIVRDERLAAVQEDLPTLAHDLGKHATGEEVILDIGARVKSHGSPRPLPATPTGLELSMGDEDGELTGQCNGQPGMVDYYEIQYTTADPLQPGTTWQFADTSKRSTFEIKGLPSGQKVWIRLRAINTAGKSNWCDPACKRVP